MAHDKVPLLALKLSSQSFLDSEIRDNFSTHPLYTTTTTSTLTTVSRIDPWGASSTASEIKWPKERPVNGKGKANDTDCIMVQMWGSRWKSGHTFLRPGTFTNTCSFNIPKYSQPLKWRLVGSSYCCTAASVKGPIATFDAAAGPIPACIKVYETLTGSDGPSDLDTHRGVSILLLDYLVITALLLATDVQECMGVQRFEGDGNTPLTTPSLRQSLRTITRSTSAFQWRKIMYREPIFPKRSRTVTSQTCPDRSPMSSGQMAKLAYGVPIYPTLRSNSSSFFSSYSDLEDEPEGESNCNGSDGDIGYEAVARPPSPSAESLYCPQTIPSAPSHTYLDPSFYDLGVPPVPPLPSHYHNGGVPQSPISRPSSSMTQSEQCCRSSSSADHSTSSNNSRQLVSVSSRPLPTPPVLAHSHSTTLPAHSLQHARSPGSPARAPSQSNEKRQSRYATARSLPPTPVSSSAVRVEDMPHPPTRFAQPNYNRLLHAHHKTEEQNSFVMDPYNREPQNAIIDAPPTYSSLFGGNFS